jgi:hypothetical protein
MDPAMLDMALDESRLLTDIHSYNEELDGTELSDALMIERFRDHPHGDLLFHAQAFALELKEAEEQSRQFVRHTLRALDIARKRKEIKSLEERLKQGKLNRDEQSQYSKMISDVRALEQQLQVDGRMN